MGPHHARTREVGSESGMSVRTVFSADWGSYVEGDAG